MATLKLLVDAGEAARLGVGTHPHVVLVGESGRRFELPLAPNGAERSGDAARYASFERVGRKGLIVRAGADLVTYNLTMMLVGRDADGYISDQVPVETELGILRAMTQSGERVHWEGYGPSKGGLWLITSYSERDVRLRHGTNEVTQSEVTLTLTESAEGVVAVGPVTGGAAPAPAAEAPPVETAGPAPTTSQTYTVRSGDTLSGISVKFYGTSSRWTQIADANGITNPKTLAVGKVLTIPPK
jgi:LysM repeat protein